jgi:ABC-type glycerol-3-phosphate transport system permease component
VQALAKSIPQRANFFITYIMLDAWSIPAGELLRFWPLIMYHIKNFFFVKTERDRLRATSPGTISLDESLPQLELYFLMGLVYSVISPVIMPFIVLFFGFGFVVYRHQVSDSIFHAYLLSLLSIEHLCASKLFRLPSCSYMLIYFELSPEILCISCVNQRDCSLSCYLLLESRM